MCHMGGPRLVKLYNYKWFRLQAPVLTCHVVLDGDVTPVSVVPDQLIDLLS